MYDAANEVITRQGLSLGSRILLGLVATLFGLIMVGSAAESDSPLLVYLAGAFCFCIAIACVTQGRVRQFVGGIIAVTIIGAAGAYLWSEIAGGPLFSARKSEPSVLNALLFAFFFGVPSAVYVYRTRFGFARKKPESDAAEDPPGGK